MPHTVEVNTPLETILVEQALLMARELQPAADQAPDGHVLEHAEATALAAGRELTRRALETALQTQADDAEKKRAGPHLRLRATELLQRQGVEGHGDSRRPSDADTPLPPLEVSKELFCPSNDGETCFSCLRLYGAKFFTKSKAESRRSGRADGGSSVREKKLNWRLI